MPGYARAYPSITSSKAAAAALLPHFIYKGLACIWKSPGSGFQSCSSKPYTLIPVIIIHRQLTHNSYYTSYYTSYYRHNVRRKRRKRPRPRPRPLPRRPHVPPPGGVQTLRTHPPLGPNEQLGLPVQRLGPSRTRPIPIRRRRIRTRRVRTRRNPKRRRLHHLQRRRRKTRLVLGQHLQIRRDPYHFLVPDPQGLHGQHQPIPRVAQNDPIQLELLLHGLFGMAMRRMGLFRSLCLNSPIGKVVR